MKLLLLLALFTTGAYGAFTPFPPASPPSNSIVTKGGLLTSDGSAQFEYTACADGKVLEYLSTETHGILCGDKTVDTNAGTICTTGEYLDGDGNCQAEVVNTNAGTICSSGQYLDGDGTCKSIPVVTSPNYGVSSSCGSFSSSSSSYVDITNLSVTITTTGNPVYITLTTDNGENSPGFYSGGSTTIRIVRGATDLGDSVSSSASIPLPVPSALDVIGAGTHTYKVQMRHFSAGSGVLQHYKLAAWELK